MESGLIERCPIGDSSLRAYALASLMKSVMPSAAVPYDWLKVFYLRRSAGRLVSVTLVMGH